MQSIETKPPYKYHIVYYGTVKQGSVNGSITMSLTYPLEYADDILCITSYIENNCAVINPIITFIYPLKDLKRPDEEQLS